MDKALLAAAFCAASTAFAAAPADSGAVVRVANAGHHAEPTGTSGDGDMSAVGGPGVAADATRTIEIAVDDSMRFTPDAVQVQPGQTVRFVVVNQGKTRHEMTIGTMAELKEHEKMMAAMPDMANGVEPNMVAVPPGGKGELVWRFGQAGAVDFACTMPGHMQAGMLGKVLVR